MKTHPIIEAETETVDSPRESVVSLYREKDPATEETLTEKPIHRIICYRAAAGDTPKQIADAVGYTVQRVRQILSWERSRTLIAQIIHEEFEDDVTKVLQGAAPQAVIQLIELSESAESETVKLNASREILDRVLGKSPQKIEADKSPKKLLEKTRNIK